MADNIIQLNRFRVTPDPVSAPPRYLPTLDARVPHFEPEAKGRDGRRRTGAKSRSIEPNITQITGANGKQSYRVQLRKSVAGVQRSFAETFSTLNVARKWKKRRLAEFELHGVEIVAKSGDTVADAIEARLTAHQNLGRSAKQQLGWLRDSAFGQQKLGSLWVQTLLKLADEMLAEERAPRTVAGYLTFLVQTLDWASRRNFLVPVEGLRTAMEQMWEDEVLARSEERNRRPSLEELTLLLQAVTSNKRRKIPPRDLRLGGRPGEDGRSRRVVGS